MFFNQKLLEQEGYIKRKLFYSLILAFYSFTLSSLFADPPRTRELSILGRTQFHTLAPNMLSINQACEPEDSCCQDVKIELVGALPEGLFFAFPQANQAIILGKPKEGTEGTYPVTFIVSGCFDAEGVPAYTFEKSVDLTVQYAARPNPPKNVKLRTKKRPFGGKLFHPIAKLVGCIQRSCRFDHILAWDLPDQPVGSSPIVLFKIYRDAELKQLLTFVRNTDQKRFIYRIPNIDVTQKAKYYIVSENGLGIISKPLIFKKKKA